MAALLFRFRVVIFILLYAVGFFAPWEMRSASRDTLWLAASTWAARTGWISLASATLLITLVACACLLTGAMLRVCGTAYIGSGVMSGFTMQGDTFVAAGPYAYVRNPLYLGAWLLALGVSILMPPSGAAVFLLVFTVFVLFLISAEERFLAAKLGEPYQQYRRRVPRLLPRIADANTSSAIHPQWVPALLAETYPIAITICFAVFAWRYNARILIQCVLICYGVSLVVRALAKPSITAVRADSL
jgi:protein-S-isoprenylcysteine O-methyltransferase Ste14